MGLFLIIGTAAICCYTGKILVDCLYEEDINKKKHRVRNSYADIGTVLIFLKTLDRPFISCPCIPSQKKFKTLQSAAVVWGDRLASLIINTCMVLECTMICVLYIVVVGDLFTKAIENTEGTGQNYLSNIFLLSKTARKNI